jgi:hypothetical protein
MIQAYPNEHGVPKPHTLSSRRTNELNPAMITRVLSRAEIVLFARQAPFAQSCL